MNECTKRYPDQPIQSTFKWRHSFGDLLIVRWLMASGDVMECDNTQNPETMGRRKRWTRFTVDMRRLGFPCFDWIVTGLPMRDHRKSFLWWCRYDAVLNLWSIDWMARGSIRFYEFSRPMFFDECIQRSGYLWSYFFYYLNAVFTWSRQHGLWPIRWKSDLNQYAVFHLWYCA